MTLSNVTERLQPGGFFVGTTLNAYRLVKLLRSIRGNVWSNSVCRLEFDESTDKDEFPEFGAKYSFSLVEAVDNLPEYLVHFSVLEAIAAEYGLKLVVRQEFPAVYEEYKSDPQFGNLMERMGVYELSPDEWQANSQYKARPTN